MTWCWELESVAQYGSGLLSSWKVALKESTSAPLGSHEAWCLAFFFFTFIYPSLQSHILTWLFISLLCWWHKTHSPPGQSCSCLDISMSLRHLTMDVSSSPEAKSQQDWAEIPLTWKTSKSHHMTVNKSFVWFWTTSFIIYSCCYPDLVMHISLLWQRIQPFLSVEASQVLGQSLVKVRLLKLPLYNILPLLSIGPLSKTL